MFSKEDGTNNKECSKRIICKTSRDKETIVVISNDWNDIKSYMIVLTRDKVSLLF